jgi:hypothetical protein
MFGMFKKKVAPDDVSDISLDIDEPPSAEVEQQEYVALCERTDERIFNEFPAFKRYIQMHPHTCVDSVSLQMKYDDAYDVAEREVRRTIIRSGQEMSEQDKLFLIKERAVELAIEAAELEDAVDFAERQAIEQAYQNVISGNKLDGIRDAVDRSAVAANAIDTMKAHPFLTGFLGAHIVGKLKG